MDMNALLDNAGTSAGKKATKAQTDNTAVGTPEKGSNSMAVVAESVAQILALRQHAKELKEDEKALKDALKKTHEIDGKTLNSVIALLEKGEFDEFVARHDRVTNLYANLKKARK